MGRLFVEYLDGDKVYSCKKCKMHLVDKDQLISKVSLDQKPSPGLRFQHLTLR